MWRKDYFQVCNKLFEKDNTGCLQVSSLSFWLLLHDTNIITNAELNCPSNNSIIEIGEDCSWFMIPYISLNLIFSKIPAHELFQGTT